MPSMSPEVRTFSESWLRRNAHIIEAVIRLEGGKPHTCYGAAIARLLADVDTERRPDA